MNTIAGSVLVRSGLLLLAFGRLLPAQASLAQETLSKVADKFSAAKQFAFAGDLEITRKSGAEAQRIVLESAKVKFAAGSAGKCLLSVAPTGKPPYVLMSDGGTSWAYMPTRNKYAERPGLDAFVGCQDPGTQFQYEPGSKRDLAADFTRRVVPMLASLGDAIEFTDVRGAVLSVIFKKDEQGRQQLVYLTLNLSTLAISRLTWLYSVPAGEDKAIVRAEFTFTNFTAQGPLDENQFTFTPPKRVKRVDSLPIPENEPAKNKRS